MLKAIQPIRDVALVTKTDERELAQVERILRSETFRTSGALRHLLSFLAGKTFSGEADALKEYTVAIDALQRPKTYDPQHDSTVRIQVSRLRQKLGEYYRGEGKNDSIIVDLPKGRYRLTFEERPVVQQNTASVAKIRKVPMLIWVVTLVCFILLIATVWTGYPAIRSRQSETISSTALTERSPNSEWTPELQALWGPFVANGHPLILGVEDPLFMKLERGDGVYYMDKSIDDWKKLTETPTAINLRKSLNNPKVQPSHNYSTTGEVDTAFIIGKFLGPRQQNISLS